MTRPVRGSDVVYIIRSGRNVWVYRSRAHAMRETSGLAEHERVILHNTGHVLWKLGGTVVTLEKITRAGLATHADWFIYEPE